MKKLAFVLTIVLIFSISLLTPCVVFAEEGPAGAENATQESTKTEETFSLATFFEEKILPHITTAATAIATLLVAAGPLLKKLFSSKKQLGELKGLYTATVEENATLKEIAASVDIDAIRTKISEGVSAAVKEAVNKLKIDAVWYAEIKTGQETISAQLQSVINGAMNAWAQSPGAVACLTSAPTESALKKAVAENKAMEQYIREMKGEEAEALLNSIKETA